MKTLMTLFVAGIVSFGAVTVSTGDAEAGARSSSKYSARSGKSPQVRGYVRRGGYSYDASDTVNTIGGYRSLYGSTNVYRDFSLDQQTIGGPFDHGFFFDSGIGAHGGNSPYMN